MTKEYGMETYLVHINNKKHQRIVSKLRTSSHDLMIEKGRYYNLPREKRLCMTCNTVEDEFNFLNKCTKYDDLMYSL